MAFPLRGRVVSSAVPAVLLGLTLALGAACGQIEAKPDPTRVALGGSAGAGSGAVGGQAAASAGAGGASGRGGAEPVGAGAGGAAVEPEDPTVCPQKGAASKMARITRADGRAACIDEHEVTQGEYHAYALEIGVEGYVKAGICKNEGIGSYGRWPESYDGWGGTQPIGDCPRGPYDPEKYPDAPVGCLAHCHAEAYCAWVGKELCGGFDDGEPLNEKQMLDPQVSIWANACQNGGTTESSHASKSPEACGPVRTTRDGQTESVDAFPECHGQGAYTQINGLSGGVVEWVNGRVEPLPGALSILWVTMGPLWGFPDAPACGFTPMGADFWANGFRCCKRLPK